MITKINVRSLCINSAVVHTAGSTVVSEQDPQGATDGDQRPPTWEPGLWQPQLQSAR